MFEKCLDGSSEIKEAEDGHCEKEEEVMCTARDGEFVGKKICVEKKFQCDKKKRIFTRDQRVICRSPLLKMSNDTGSGKFYPMRAIRCIRVIVVFVIVMIIINVSIIITSWSGAT